jgi:hypothetical protein
LAAFKQFGLLPADSSATSEPTVLHGIISEFAGAWGHGYGDPPFRTVYETLEKLKRFS